MNGTSKRQDGFTMMESIVSLFVVSMLVVVLVGLSGTRAINRNTSYRSQAAALADEEIDALRRLPFASLPTQTDGTFLNTSYNAGSWTVVADASNPASHSVPNVLELAGTSGFSGKESGRLQFPAGRYDAVSLTAKWFVRADSPGSWNVGYLFRTRDAANGYRLRVGDSTSTDFLPTGTPGIQNVLLEKIQNGTATTVTNGYATVTPLHAGSWFTLQITATGSSITVTLNSTPLFTVTDATWSTGAAALIGWDGVHAAVDDVQDGTGTWDFGAATPTMPVEWIRLGLNDLPDATPTTFNDNGLLTVASYPDASSASLRQATVTVRWRQQGTERTYTTSTLIGKSGLGS